MSGFFEFCCSVHIVCLFRNEGVPSFRVGASLFSVFCSEGRKEASLPFGSVMAIVEGWFS